MFHYMNSVARGARTRWLLFKKKEKKRYKKQNNKRENIYNIKAQERKALIIAFAINKQLVAVSRRLVQLSPLEMNTKQWKKLLKQSTPTIFHADVNKE